MNLQKVLWSVLVGCVMVILSLVGAWGHDVTSRVTRLEVSHADSDKKAAATDQKLEDLHQDLLRIERLLEKQ